MIFPKADTDRLKEWLSGPARRIVIVTHTNPDGDAVGSSLAWAEKMRELGHRATCIVPNKYPYFLDWMPGIGEIIVHKNDPEGRAARAVAEADMIFCLDFNAVTRLESLSETIAANTTARRVLIDHHLSPADGFDLRFSYPEASSTCYLVYTLLAELFGVEAITRTMGESLYVGMMTDTGNFAYNCNDPELYIVVAELVRKGADKEKLNNMLFNTFSAHCMRLNAYAILRKMELLPEVKGSLIVLSRDELNRFHYTRGDTEGLVNKPLAIPGVEFSVFMRQESDCIRVSMRSRGDFPVNILCSDYFGGGGHLNAAGGEFYGTLDDAVAHFKEKLSEIRKRFIG